MESSSPSTFYLTTGTRGPCALDTAAGVIASSRGANAIRIKALSAAPSTGGTESSILWTGGDPGVDPCIYSQSFRRPKTLSTTASDESCRSSWRMLRSCMMYGEGLVNVECIQWETFAVKNRCHFLFFLFALSSALNDKERF